MTAVDSGGIQRYRSIQSTDISCSVGRILIKKPEEKANVIQLTHLV